VEKHKGQAWYTNPRLQKSELGARGAKYGEGCRRFSSRVYRLCKQFISLSKGFELRFILVTILPTYMYGYLRQAKRSRYLYPSLEPLSIGGALVAGKEKSSKEINKRKP